MTLCILCPGQGSQTVEMLPRLLAEPLISPHLEPLLAAMPFDAMAVSQNSELCFANAHAQPLIVAAGAAVANALKAQGKHANLSAGYSIGELTAHLVAGSVQALDGIEQLKQFFREAKAWNETPGHTETNLKFNAVKPLFSKKQKLYVPLVAAAALKIYMAVFYGFVLIPYVYLYIVPLISSVFVLYYLRQQSRISQISV